MAIEIVDFPINSMVIFHGKMLVHQRVRLSYNQFLTRGLHFDLHPPSSVQRRRGAQP